MKTKTKSYLLISEIHNTYLSNDLAINIRVFFPEFSL